MSHQHELNSIMENKRHIFIAGITGNQGGAVAKHVLLQNKSIVGLTRNANSDKAKHWKAQGVTVIDGNINNPDAFESFLDQTKVIYLVQALQPKKIRNIKRKTIFV